MFRNIEHHFIQWKNNLDKKPLIVRGPRQVGKTYSIRNLGASFEYFLEINFEEHQNIKTFFDGDLSPQAICEKLSLYFKKSIISGKTLLFFDEIQSCEGALRSLRFFYEKMPDLHVVSAGSLLEFALADIPSYGVGRLSYLFMYPLSFEEFLIAKGEKKLQKLIDNASFNNPIEDVFHKKLIGYFKTFLVLGGMP